MSLESGAVPTRQDCRRKIVEAARDMIAGRLHFIEGARIIVSCRRCAQVADFDPDISIFIGIVSETDALPLGDVREHWSPGALEKLEPEIARAEKWTQDVASANYANLVARFDEGARE